jgi:ribosomal protein L37AE/L43A
VKYAHRIICPMCGAHELQPHSRNSTRCPSCGPLEGAFLKTLFQIIALPDAIDAYACDCGHPVMRRLPDDVYRCPACGLEVVSVSSPRCGRSPQP